MTQATTNPVATQSPAGACSPAGRSILGNWKFWLIVAAAAVVIVAAMNRSWLIAVGISPLLFAALPCVAMCALGLCAHNRAQT